MLFSDCVSLVPPHTNPVVFLFSVRKQFAKRKCLLNNYQQILGTHIRHHLLAPSQTSVSYRHAPVSFQQLSYGTFKSVFSKKDGVADGACDELIKHD